MPSMQDALEIHDYSEGGYKPLVLDPHWQVALLNWAWDFNPDGPGEIERHVDTDEVFVLWRGRGALYVATDDGLSVVDMTPGTVYNVKRGTWHGMVATPDASCLIVETRDTHLRDTEVRAMSPDEFAQLKAQIPAWLL